MVLDEQELRHHLAAAADRASAPRFTVDDLTGRIRRRRAKITGLVSGSLLAVAAIAVAVPVALSGPGTPPTAHPAVGPFRLSFTVAVNGQPRVFPKNGPPPSFTATPGEHLRIRIGVTVPAHAEVTTLWLGISRGVFTAPGPHGRRPASMRRTRAWDRALLSLSRRAEPVMKRVTMAGNRARWIGGLLTAIALATAGCGSVASSTREGSLPPRYVGGVGMQASHTESGPGVLYPRRAGAPRSRHVREGRAGAVAG